MILLELGESLLIASLVYHIAGIRWAIRNKNRWPNLVGVLVVLYLGSYTVLSLQGSYVLANHGGSHYTRAWCPKYVIVEYTFIRGHVRPTLLAALYLPLVVVDRLVVHPGLEPWDGYYDSESFLPSVDKSSGSSRLSSSLSSDRRKSAKSFNDRRSNRSRKPVISMRL